MAEAAAVPLWKRALGTIVELEPKQDKVPKILPTSSPVVYVGSGPAPQQRTVNQELLQELMKASLKRRTAFSNLVDSAERLRSVIPDDAQRIKAAVVTTGDVTAVAIKQALSAHESDLVNEITQFVREITSLREERVGKVNGQALDIEKQIDVANGEIARLQASITSMTEQTRGLKATAQASEVELADNATTFEVTADQVKQYLSSMGEAILSAIK